MSRRSRRLRKLQEQQSSLSQPAASPNPSKWKWLPILFFFIAYLNVAVGSFFYPLDYDLGWHLRYGQDVVVNHEISSINKWAVDMPGHRWINSSWLSDVLRYVVFTNWYFQGLMIAGIVTMVITFWLYAKAGKLSWWDAVLIFPFIVFMEIPLTSASFRAQLLSFTGMGAILWILRSYQDGNKKALYFLVPIFFLWANLHGGFFLGILYLAGWTGLFIIQKVYLEKVETLAVAVKTHGLYLAIAIAASLLITLINPWGIELYVEHVLVDFGSHIEKVNPSQFLVEWKPLYQNSGIFTNHIIFGLIYLAASFVVIWKRRHVPIFPLMILTALMYFAAINSRRFAWTLYLLAIPIFSEATKILEPKNKWVSGAIGAVVSLIFFAYAVNSLVPTRFFQTDWNLYCQLTGCSPQSANYILSRNLQNTKMYTTYDWGGWLIWNYPQIRPLVDGRMSTWIDDKGYNAFLHYIDYENNWKDIDQSEYDVVYLSPGKRALFNRLLELVDQKKWIISYRDNYAFVFIRNDRKK